MSTATAPSSGRLLAWLTAVFYALFTLLPDSHSLMVAWPWAFIWQVGLLCPMLWWLSQVFTSKSIPRLGQPWDSAIAVILGGLLLSSMLAVHPAQARWYTWAGFGCIAALYALIPMLRSPQTRLMVLKRQGYLSLAFIVLSLGLWLTQTIAPERSRLAEIRAAGFNIAFQPELSLQNWAPLGHQNYVAGYLVLSLPLLVGLAIATGRSPQRWLWLGGAGLGIVDLYTTSSRGGWLGLAVMGVGAAIALLGRSKLPKTWIVGGSLAGAVGLLVFILANARLRALLAGLLSGRAIDALAYRWINTVAGWQMGLDHLLTGTGLGGVLLLYQRYRPDWAGREAEDVYQLHGTPIQIWAELGLLGALIMVVAIAAWLWFTRAWWQTPTDQRVITNSDWVLAGSVLLGSLGYGALSLTDYQLDNVAISGLLILYGAIAVSLYSAPLATADPAEEFESARGTTVVTWGGVGFILVLLFWLVPAQRAWQLSDQAFLALAQTEPDINQFAQTLNEAHELAPWEPYYSDQLGWYLGNVAYESQAVQPDNLLTEDALDFLQRSTVTAPAAEFAHSNLAWLRLQVDPTAATPEFAQSLTLVPAKPGLFYGLGLSFVAQGDRDRALAAFTLEILRDPLFMTSPVWRGNVLGEYYAELGDRLEARYGELLDQATDAQLERYLHQSRGGVRWWLGDFDGAAADWTEFGNPVQQAIAAVNQRPADAPTELTDLPPASPAALTLQAWLSDEAEARSQLLGQAWVTALRQAPVPTIQTQLTEGMAQTDSLHTWLTETSATRQYRYTRAGFGVLSRHIDGLIPEDFWQVNENIPATQLLPDLLPSPKYLPVLDLALQPQREELLATIATEE